jgi:hypothetical protein
MTRYSKKNGKYYVSGSKYEMLIGTRAQVWHGTALKTSGGLKKSDLFKNKAGRIVSKSKHASAKRENRLVKNGYGTKKGKFGFVRLNGTSKRGKSKKMRGGKAFGNSFSPAHISGNGIDGQGLTNYGLGSTNVQFMAGQAGGRKSKRMRGGKGYGWLSGSGIDGQGITKYTNGASSIDVQLAAGQAGGRRRKRGGTTKPMNIGMNMNTPLNRALNA